VFHVSISMSTRRIGRRASGRICGHNRVPDASLAPSAMHAEDMDLAGGCRPDAKLQRLKTTDLQEQESREGFRNNSDVISFVLPLLFYHFEHTVYSTSIYVKR